MTGWRTFQAWAAVHGARTMLSVLLGVSLASLLFGDSTMESIAFVHFPTPVALLLVIPAIAGVGAATGCVNGARLPLPDPPRAVVARAVWALGCAALGFLAANAGQLSGAAADWAAVGRNVVVYFTLGLIAVVLGFPHLAWLPVLAYLLACMLFGLSFGGEYYPWAAVMEAEATAQWVVMGPLFGAVVLAYTFLPAVRRYRRAPSRDLSESVRS